MSARLEGVAALKAKFAAMRQESVHVMRTETKASLLNIEGQAKRNVRVDRGGLRNSITHELDPDGLGGRAGTAIEYGPAEEFGSRPHWPPIEPLKDWARRHGMEESAAYAIAAKIAREGTEAAPFLFPAFEEERPKYIERIRAGVARVVRKFGGSAASRRVLG